MSARRVKKNVNFWTRRVIRRIVSLKGRITVLNPGNETRGLIEGEAGNDRHIGLKIVRGHFNILDQVRGQGGRLNTKNGELIFSRALRRGFEMASTIY